MRSPSKRLFPEWLIWNRQNCVFRGYKYPFFFPCHLSSCYTFRDTYYRWRRDRRSNKMLPQPRTYLAAICLMFTAAATAAVPFVGLLGKERRSLTTPVVLLTSTICQEGTGDDRQRQRGCTVMLIPSVSNETADKQKGLQERQGREGIIRVLERKRGTVSAALESVSHAIRIKRARPTITEAAQGNKSQLLLLLLPSTVKCEVLSERERATAGESERFSTSDPQEF